MSDDYLPPSDFLQSCLNDDVTLSGSVFAEANLARLIAMTRDEDVANRDWATILLAQTDLDTPEIRAAFKERLGDEDSIVRGEALVGLAQRDPALALPLVITELGRRPVGLPTMEAAEEIADAKLLPHLLPWLMERATPSDHFDEALEQAVRACGGDPDQHTARSSNRRGPGGEGYHPESQFLLSARYGEVDFENHPRAAHNLRELLSYVHDDAVENRDWAAFLIAQLPLDTPEIRAALLHAAEDENEDVRDEALIGLARRDRAAALARIEPLLEQGAGVCLLEAATITADKSLLPMLRALEGSESGDEETLGLLRQAVVACEAGEWIYMRKI